MSERVKLVEDDEIETKDRASDYFGEQNSNLQFVSTGSALLDCTLGGGWPLSRISNVVGDESSGKTLLAIEAMANFHRKFPEGEMYYRESEAAFDIEYANALGMPTDNVDFLEADKFVTVSDFYNDLVECAKHCRKRNIPGFYVCDSLDALSDEQEMAQKDFDAGGYPKKAKDMAKLLRMIKGEVSQANMHLMIISQTRYKIDAVAFGEKKTRSGGKALDFYCSQILWLAHAGDVTQTIKKIKRPIGIQVKANCKKNKIALPHRRCDFVIRFGQGIDALETGMKWIDDVGYWDEVFDESKQAYKNKLDQMSDKEYWAETRRVEKEISRIWKEIEKDFLDNARQKYREDNE